MKKTTFYSILYFLLLFPFFKSPYITNNYEFINDIYNVLQILCTFIIIFLIFKEKKTSKIIILIGIFEAIIIFSTIILDGNLKNSIFDAIQTISLCTIMDYGLKKHTNSTLKGLLVLFEILITINLITIFMFPKGMYINPINNFTENWFLGFDNMHIIYIIIGLTISVIYSLIVYKKLGIRAYYLLIVSLITVLIRWTGTGLVGISLLLIYLLFKGAINKLKIFNIKNYTLISIILFLSIILFRIQNYFSYIIVNVLKKDLTFSRRTYIWDRAIIFIKEHPLLGNGYMDGYLRQFKYKIWGAVHAHNEILEILYLGGFVLLFVFIMIILSTIKKLYKNRKNKISKFISWILFVCFIMMLTEVYSFDKIFLLIIIAYNIDILIKE